MRSPGRWPRQSASAPTTACSPACRSAAPTASRTGCSRRRGGGAPSTSHAGSTCAATAAHTSRRPRPYGQHSQVEVPAESMRREYPRDAPSPFPYGFFLTGDLGRLDTHGNLLVTGRLKLLIDVGGLKVNPLEVETVLA